MGRGHPHLNGCRSGRPRGAPHLLKKQGHISPLPLTPAPPQDPKAQLCGPDLGDAKARGRSLWLGPAVQLWGCDGWGGSLALGRA